MTNQKACELLSLSNPLWLELLLGLPHALCPPPSQPQATSAQGGGRSDPPGAEASESELHHPRETKEGPGGAEEPLETDHAVSKLQVSQNVFTTPTGPPQGPLKAIPPDEVQTSNKELKMNYGMKLRSD